MRLLFAVLLALAFFGAAPVPAPRPIVPPTPTLDQLHPATPFPLPPTLTPAIARGYHVSTTTYLPLIHRAAIR